MKPRKNQKSNLLQGVISFFDDSNFLYAIDRVKRLTSKILSLLMIFLILVSVGNLILVTIKTFLSEAIFVNHKILFNLFGLFLNVLIALEILKNITAYLRKKIFQVELAIASSLVSVSRKIIIFDFNQLSAMDLIGLAIATLALLGSYWIVRNIHRQEKRTENSK